VKRIPNFETQNNSASLLSDKSGQYEMRLIVERLRRPIMWFI